MGKGIKRLWKDVFFEPCVKDLEVKPDDKATLPPQNIEFVDEPGILRALDLEDEWGVIIIPLPKYKEDMKEIFELLNKIDLILEKDKF
jgi:hypothetical protein